MKRKQPFSLIEILVGMALFSLLASVLFSLYIGMVKMEKEQAKREERIEREIKIRTLLQRSLGRAAPNDEAYYHSEGDTISFLFNNGVDPDPHFSSNIPGRIFLDDGEVLLEEGRERKRTYILAAGVRELSFEALPPFAVKVMMDQESYAIILQESPPIIIMK